MADTIGILGMGTSLADGEMPHERLAELHGTSVESVRRVIGNSHIHLSEVTAEAHAICAAQRCLADAGVEASAVDMIIWCSGSKRRALFGAAALVQAAIGADNAFCTDLGNNCSEFVMALRMARATIADNPDIHRVLVVSGEEWSEWVPRRTLEPLTETNYPNIFSDGGAAVLVGRTERQVLAGFGFATNGKYWNLIEMHHEVADNRVRERCSFAGQFPDERQLALDLTRLFRVSLSRCLHSAGITREQIDHVALPLSGPPIVAGFAKALGLPIERVIRGEPAPTHIGAPDVIHVLKMLHDSGRGQPGQHVLLAARSTGLMRFAVVRL